MKTNVIASTLCKIAAVYLFMTSAQGVSLISLKAFMITGDAGDFALGLLITVVPSAVAGIFLWKFSDRIGQVSDQPETAELSANLTTDDLLAVGIFLVGLYAVLFGLVDIIGVEGADWLARSMPDRETDYQSHALIRNWTRRAGYLLQIFLGVGLIYGRLSLVALSHKFRRIESDGS